MNILGLFRYTISVIVLGASAPNYFLVWAIWRGISIFLPKHIYQIGDDFLYSMYQRMVVFFFEHCTGQKVYISGDTAEIFKKKENVLYLGNHQSTGIQYKHIFKEKVALMTMCWMSLHKYQVDWIICNMVAIRQGSIGHLRYVMKDTLQMLPLYGHYFYQHGCIYVKRGDFKQRKMEEALEYLQDPKIKSWTVIFPEGTCFAPNEYELIKKSLKVANESGLKPLQNHLTPRSRGTFLALVKLRSNVNAIYDVTCVYSGSLNEKNERIPAPDIVDFLLGKNRDLHIHVRRIPIEDVPEDETLFKKWMHDLFILKDEIVTQFYLDGQFKEGGINLKSIGKQHNLSYLATLPSVLFFVATYLPLLYFPSMIWLWFQGVMLSTILGYSWLAIKSVC